MSTVVYYPDKFTIDDTNYAKTGSNNFNGNQNVTGNITLGDLANNRFVGTASYAMVAAQADTTLVAAVPQNVTGSNITYAFRVIQSGSGNSIVVQNENDTANSKAFYITNSGSIGIGKVQSSLPYLSTNGYILDVAGNTLLSGNLEITGGLKLNNNAITSSTGVVPIRFSGTDTILNSISASSITSSGDVAVNGGKINTSAAQLTLNKTLYVSGGLEVEGNTILGDNSVDSIEFKASTLSVPNNLNIDSSTLFINSTTDRVGIGTATPNHKLDINGILSISGSGIVTNQTTFNIVTSSVTTLNIGNAATTVLIGATTGQTTVQNPLTASNIFSTNITSSNISSSAQTITKKLRVNTPTTTYDINTAGTFFHGGNLSTQGHISGSNDNQYDLGSSTIKWKTGFINSISASLITASTAITASAVTSSNIISTRVTSSFISATSAITASSLVVDTNTLFVDSVNNRVGIGTTSPTTQLDVVGDVKATSFILKNGIDLDDLNFYSDVGGNFQLTYSYTNATEIPTLTRKGTNIRIDKLHIFDYTFKLSSGVFTLTPSIKFNTDIFSTHDFDIPSSPAKKIKFEIIGWQSTSGDTPYFENYSIWRTLTTEFISLQNVTGISLNEINIRFTYMSY